MLALFLFEPIKFIKNYVTSLSESLKEQGYPITKTQQLNFTLLLSVILSCNRVFLSDVELTTMCKHTGASKWWSTKKSSLPWGKIFLFSVQIMLKSYGITGGVIAID